MADSATFLQKANLGDPNTRMFIGTLDDSVSRYPWELVKPDFGYLNRLLIFNAVLGPRLCVRIGNLLYHEPYRIALTDPSVSPLAAFCRAGFLQLQMNGSSINDSIANRIAIGTNSALKFQQRFDWRPGSEMFNRLDVLDGTLGVGVGKSTYNPEFKTHFRTIMSRLENHGSRAFRRVYDQWATNDPAALTRSNFEELAKTIHAADPDALHRAMHIVNAANHYAYGSGMKAHADNVLVETTELAILNDLTATPVGEEERVIDNSRFLTLIRLGAFDAIERKLHIPKRILHDHKSWNRFAALFDVNGDLYLKRIAPHKRAIWGLISRIMDLEEGRRLDDKISELEDTCEEYSRTLSEAMGIPIDEAWIPMVLKFAAGKVGFNVTEDMLDTAENVVVDAASQLAIPKFVSRWTWRTILTMGTADVRQQFSRVFDTYQVRNDKAYPSASDVARAFRFPSIKVVVGEP